MFETIKEFFSVSPGIAWSVVSILVAITLIASLWEGVKWWALNTWMSFPVVGRIARLSKDLNKDSGDSQWFKAEKSLCRDYKKFIRIQSEHDFNEKVEYLTKAGDNGRSPTPKWIWILTVALVFAEAMGFSYVLAGWTIPGASETTQQYGALGIAFIISVILVAFTHWAGHELYVSNKIKNARREWIEDGRKNKFRSQVMPLAKSQSLDNDQPSYTQLANRVGTHETYNITIATVAIVLIVAAGATYVRGQVLEKALHQEVTGVNNDAELTFKLSEDGLDMSVKAPDNLNLPDADISSNEASKNKAMMDQVNIDRHGGWGTFIILAFIFVFLQILGGLFGYKWGFAGQNSKAAFKAIGNGRYASYSEVRATYKNIADTAQSKLELLQQKLMDRVAVSGNGSIHTSNKFIDFMKISREEEEDDDESHDTFTKNQKLKSDAIVAEPINKEVNKLNLKDVLQQVQAMQDKETKKQFILNLPEDIRKDVLIAIKDLQESEKAKLERSKIESELDSLL